MVFFHVFPCPEGAVCPFGIEEFGEYVLGADGNEHTLLDTVYNDAAFRTEEAVAVSSVGL